MYLTTTKSKDAEKYIYTESYIRTFKTFVPFQVQLQEEELANDTMQYKVQKDSQMAQKDTSMIKQSGNN